MPILADLGIAAAIALVVFFLVLGLLVLFVENVEVKWVLGGLFILLGFSVALVAMSEPGIALVLMAAIAALVLDQVLEHFTTL